MYCDFENSIFGNRQMLGLIILLVIGCGGNTKKPTTSTDVKMKVIESPYPALQVKRSVFLINNEKDTTIIYTSGSTIFIPKHAFLDSAGNPIKSIVNLNYREYSNAFEVYLAGIPMLFEINGENQVFETGGMLEINANADGKPVFVNPNNKIQINQSSFESADNYNTYQLDTNNGKWKQLTKSKAKIERYDEQIANLPKLPPLPKKAGIYAFEIEDVHKKQPELSMYKNVLFEPINNERFGFDATSVNIKDLGNGIYKVTFNLDYNSFHQEESANCYLAFAEGKDYNDAIKTYQKKYGKLVKQRAKAKEAIDREWKTYNEARSAYLDLGLKKLFDNEVDTYQENEKVSRALSLAGFGIINVDRPSAYPQGANLIPIFANEEGKIIKLNNVALIEKGRNAIFNYDGQIKFDPEKENTLFGFTDDQKIAYFKPTDFKKVNQKSGNYTFKMTVYPKELKSYREICNVLF